MEIRELRSFVAVAHAGSFSRAAADLHIAQPALSRQIAKLEEELRIALFVRHGRGVALTPAGARLLERAERVIFDLRETSEYVRDDASQERGQLAVGLTPAIGQIVGPDFVRRFRDQWPNAQLLLREGLSTSLQNWLIDGQVHLAIVYNQPLIEAFELQPLFTEPMVLVGPPGAATGAVRFADLSDIPLILPAMPHSNRRLIEQAALQNNVRLKVALEVDSVALTRRLVRNGLGYSITAHLAVQDDVRAGLLSSRAIDRPGLRSTVAIATLGAMQHTPLANSGGKILIEEVRRLVTEGQWKEGAIWKGVSR